MNLNIDDNIELSLEIRETLLRIAQEALANIARHSSARCGDVSLQHGVDAVTLTIKDDGGGFDSCAQHGGLGLRSMRDRTVELGGSFKVESAPGQGIQIFVALPVESR